MEGDIFKTLYKSRYFKDEAKRYAATPLSSEPQTGALQKRIEGIEEKVQKISRLQDLEMSSLRMQIERNALVIEDLGARLDMLEEQRGASEEIVEIRDISIGQAKKEMIALLTDGKTRYADEIATELNLDIRVVIEAFKQLEKEEKLFIDEDKL